MNSRNNDAERGSPLDDAGQSAAGPDDARRDPARDTAAASGVDVTPPPVEDVEAAETAETADAGAAAGAVEPVVVPRWAQAALVAVTLFVLVALAWAAAPVLLTFVVAGIVALVINPLVELVQRTRMPRGLAIAVLIRPITNQVVAFQDDLPALIDSANASWPRCRPGSATTASASRSPPRARPPCTPCRRRCCEAPASH